ncbi:MAG: hypothetical protein GXP32_08870 [Kiritimatiellaeota bacterium]|nr:hypothetical protein [Kiritimatiellota bacterium]
MNRRRKGGFANQNILSPILYEKAVIIVFTNARWLGGWKSKLNAYGKSATYGCFG